MAKDYPPRIMHGFVSDFLPHEAWLVLFSSGTSQPASRTPILKIGLEESRKGGKEERRNWKEGKKERGKKERPIVDLECSPAQLSLFLSFYSQFLSAVCYLNYIRPKSLVLTSFMTHIYMF